MSDVFIACVDGLKVLSEALATVFPRTTLQTCVVHLVSHCLSFVSEKDRKAVAAALKVIYQAATEANSLEALDQFQITGSGSIRSSPGRGGPTGRG